MIHNDSLVGSPSPSTKSYWGATPGPSGAASYAMPHDFGQLAVTLRVELLHDQKFFQSRRHGAHGAVQHLARRILAKLLLTQNKHEQTTSDGEKTEPNEANAPTETQPTISG